MDPRSSNLFDNGEIRPSLDQAWSFVNGNILKMEAAAMLYRHELADIIAKQLTWLYCVKASN